MSTESEKRNEPIYFPLDQGERASHHKVNQLLARVVYERLAEMLHESLPKLHEDTDGEHDDERFARGRGHSTIFLDGDRGTGKTTVIVNLPRYLESDEVRASFPDLANSVHILKPIDPSQLEDGDDLFLNVVVAALLGDKQVNAQRDREPQKWQALHESLQRLGKALQGRETQGDGVGLDRLRAFMGAQELAGAVHEFFDKAVQLLGKRLLVLPIDDVDTTLHRAFENLEVVRRYLASPVLLPIVCGDLSLYREVTWRDAFRRLTMDVADNHDQAKPVAEDLAREYLRKILPLHRRMRMPEVGDFIRNDEILLGTEDKAGKKPRLTLPQLEAWLQALLAGSVNGHENSQLSIPIPTVRALSQLLFRVRDQIPALEQAFYNETASQPETDLMRRIAYRRHGEAPDRHQEPTFTEPPNAESQVSMPQWREALLNHFVYESSAGAVCLVLMAARHWEQSRTGSMLASPLFEPLKQSSQKELRYIDSRAELNWKTDLTGRLPEPWVRSLADEAILPFATPEIGRAIVIADDASEYLHKFDFGMMFELITHRNFYTPAKQATLICSGRLLELLVTSLVREVGLDDIDRILAAPPYHSAAAVAATKSLLIAIGEVQEELDGSAQTLGTEPLGDKVIHNVRNRDLDIEQLSRELSSWRAKHKVNEWAKSPWLIYCVLNKTLNQAPMFNEPLKVGMQPKRESLRVVAESGLAAFNSFWAAIASFEKGPNFGLSMQLSNVNLSREGDFERNNLFMQNIRPMLDQRENRESIRGERVISLTRALAEHPLRIRLRAFVDATKLAEYKSALAKDEEKKRSAYDFLRELLDLPKDLKQFRMATLVKALRSHTPAGRSSEDFAKDIYNSMASEYPRHSLLKTLKRAISELQLAS